jgi:negative regulator of sigma E activity
MIHANLRELLSAAVDGELSVAERKTAQRLLRESPEARALFAQLKADAGRLKNLPRVAAPADLADNVMAAINDRAMTPTPLPPSRKSAPRFNWSAASIWINLVTAACVLIVISVGSYLYFAASQRYFAEQQKNVASNTPAGDSDKVDRGASKPGGAGSVAKAGVRDSGPPSDQITVLPRELGPSPRLVSGDIQLGPPSDDMPEIGPLQIDKIRVSHLFNPHELADDEGARNKLAAEMKKDELIRLDLFCRSTPGALDLVQGAFKARGIVVFTDAFAQEQLKKKSPPELMVFTEALTPDEVAQLLTALGTEDKKSGAGEFDTLVAAPFLPADLTQMSKLLGIPAVTPKPAKGKTGVDIRKPLPEGTANQVAESLSKLGSGSRPPSKNEKVAVVVAYSPVNTNPAASKEIRQFLDRRGDRKPDAKLLMLVLKTIK